MFLSPWLLWALPLALGPFLLHHLAQRTPRTFWVSSLALFKTPRPARGWTPTLRSRLKTICRALWIIALILWVAHPFFHGGPKRSGAGAVVMVMDVSASMAAQSGGMSVWEKARNVAGDWIKNFPAEDRVGTLGFSREVTWEMAPTQDRAALGRLWQTAAPEMRPTRLSAALDRALALLAAEKAPWKAVILFSDCADHGWKALSPWPSDVHLFAVEAAPPQDNAGWRWAPAPKFSLRLEGKGRTRRDFSVFGDQRILESGSLKLGEELPLGDAPLGWGEVKLDPDALTWEDHFFWVRDVNARQRWWLVDGAPSVAPVGDEAWYLTHALSALPQVETRVTPQYAGALAGSRAEDVVALLNPRILEPELSEGVRHHLQAGGGVLVTLGSNRSEGQPLADLGRDEIVRVWTGDEGLSPSTAAIQLLGQEYAWEATRVRQLLRLTPRPGETVWFRTQESRHPVLLTASQGGGRLAWLATSVDRDWTNLPSKPLFPALIKVLGEWASSLPRGRPFLWVDEIWDQSWPTGLRQLQVKRPDGTEEFLQPQGGRWVYAHTDLPGFYEALSPSGQRVGSWAVDVDTTQGEAELRRISPDVAKLFPRGRFHFLPWPDVSFQQYQRVRWGDDLGPWLAWLALAALLGEALLWWGEW